MLFSGTTKNLAMPTSKLEMRDFPILGSMRHGGGVGVAPGIGDPRRPLRLSTPASKEISLPVAATDSPDVTRDTVTSTASPGLPIAEPTLMRTMGGVAVFVGGGPVGVNVLVGGIGVEVGGGDGVRVRVGVAAEGVGVGLAGAAVGCPVVLISTTIDAPSCDRATRSGFPSPLMSPAWTATASATLGTRTCAKPFWLSG